MAERIQFLEFGLFNERDAVQKNLKQQITSPGVVNERLAAREVLRLTDGDYFRSTFDAVICPYKKYRMMAWNTNIVDWEDWLSDVGPNYNNPTADPIIDIMIVDEIEAAEDNYWKHTYPDGYCPALNYRMIAWNLNTVSWESWIAAGEPNSNNPSGDPITDLMIVEVF